MNCKRCNGNGVEPDQKAIGLAMRRLRIKAGIGLREMARQVGLTHGFLSQLETGQRRWSKYMTDFYRKQTE